MDRWIKGGRVRKGNSGRWNKGGRKEGEQWGCGIREGEK